MKIDTQALDEIVQKISSAIPDDLKTAKENIEKNARTAAEGLFQRLDLVTREEFDVQSKMLSKSQQRIKELELQVRELEQKLSALKN